MGEGVIEEHRLEELLVEKLDKISSSLEVKMGTHNLPDEHTKWGRTIYQTNTRNGDAQFSQTNTQNGDAQFCQTNTQSGDAQFARRTHSISEPSEHYI